MAVLPPTCDGNDVHGVISSQRWSMHFMHVSNSETTLRKQALGREVGSHDLDSSDPITVVRHENLHRDRSEMKGQPTHLILKIVT